MVQPSNQIYSDTPTDVIDTTNTTDNANATMDTAGIADLVSFMLALKNVDTNLQKAYEAYLIGNKAEFIAFVKASKFFQNYNSVARTRKTTKSEQPGVWQQQLDSYKLEQKKRLAEKGITWTPSIEKQVESAFDLGLDNNTLDSLVVKAKDFGKIGGTPSEIVDYLKQFAEDYGVTSMYNDAYWNSKKEKLFLGETTQQDIQTEIKDMAKQVYPGFAQGFDVGQSLASQTGYIKNTVAQVTGMDASALTYDNPMVSSWYQYKDPTTGQFTKPPQYLVAQKTKEKYFDLYAKTPSGTSYLDGLTVKILQDMGFM